jgi:hypothetical protein
LYFWSPSKKLNELPEFLGLIIKIMNFHYIFIVAFLLLIGCATTQNNETQYPAPHNNFTGRISVSFYSSEEPDDFMIRTCKYYGGVNQDSKVIIGKNYLLQDLIEFTCNNKGKLQDELNIDGKSSQRLSGTTAKNKCENLKFEVGTVEFRKCMEELTQ